MIELFEVFDAPTDVLLDELRACKIALPTAHGEERARLQNLKTTIQQELDERGTSQDVLQQLLPIVQSSNPESWIQDAPALMAAAASAPAALQQELLQLVQAGQRIAALRQGGAAAQGHAAPFPGGGMPPIGHAPAAAPLPQVQSSQVPVLPPIGHGTGHARHQPEAAQQQYPHAGHASAPPLHAAPPAVAHDGAHAAQRRQQAMQAEEQGDEEGGDEEGGGEEETDSGSGGEGGGQLSQEGSSAAAGAKPPPSKPISVMDAALQAFREEQRKLYKARKAIQKGPAKPQQTWVSKQELAAAYRGPQSGAYATLGTGGGGAGGGAAGAGRQPQAQTTQSSSVAQQPQPRSAKAAAAGLPSAAVPGSAGIAGRAEAGAQRAVPGTRATTKPGEQGVPEGLAAAGGMEGRREQQQQQQQLGAAMPIEGPGEQQTFVQAGVPGQQQEEGQAQAQSRQGAQGGYSMYAEAGPGASVSADAAAGSEGLGLAPGLSAPPAQELAQPDVGQARLRSASACDADGRAGMAGQSRDQTQKAAETEDAQDRQAEADEDGVTSSEEYDSGPGSPSPRHHQQKHSHHHHHGQARTATAGNPVGWVGSRGVTPAKSQAELLAAEAAARIGWQAGAPGIVNPSARVLPPDASISAEGSSGAAGTGLMRVDRWADWDLGDDAGVSAWGREDDEDPMAAHMERVAAAARAPNHAPPMSLPVGLAGPVQRGAGAGKARPGSAQTQAAGPTSVGGAGAGQKGQAWARGERGRYSSPSSSPSSSGQRSRADSPDAPTGRWVSNEVTGGRAKGRAWASGGESEEGSSGAEYEESEGQGGPRGRKGVASLPPLQQLQLMQQQAEADAAAARAAAAPQQHLPPATAVNGPSSPRTGQGSPQGRQPHAQQQQALARGATAAAQQDVATIYGPHFSAFHEILAMCYTPALPASLDSAALASGGPGSLLRPPMSRPQGGLSSYNVSASDLVDKFQGLSIRLGAWLEADTLRAKAPKPPAGSSSIGGTASAGPSSPSRILSRANSTGSGGLAGGPGGSQGAWSASAGGALGASSPARPYSASHSAARPHSARPTVAGAGPGAGAVTGASRLGQPDAPLTRYYAVADDTLHPEVREVLTLALGSVAGWELDPVDQITEPGKPDDDEDLGGMPASTSSRPATSAGQPSQTGPSAGGYGPASKEPAPGIYVQQRSPLAGRCNMWNLLWSWSVKARPPLGELLSWQRFNHFPEARQLTRKDLLKRHLVRYQVMHGGNARLAHLFSCLPTTFVLPKEGPVFADAFAKALHGVEPSVTQPKGLNLWIVKPVGLSRGRGIRLIRSTRELGNPTPDDPLIVQRYVTSPLLVQGHKWDLRLYVLVTSFNPLEAWLCREGFARFATTPFTLDEESLGNRFVHLTNSSVQKARAEKGELPPFLANAQPAGGSKCSLGTLRDLLKGQRIEWPHVWGRITEVVTGCLFAAQDAIPPCVNAFELFGFDILLDTSGGVWVLEVNGSPSLSLDTPLDRAIKPRMLRDALAIVDPLPFDRDALLEVLAARTSARGRLSRRPAAPAAPGLTSAASGAAGAGAGQAGAQAGAGSGIGAGCAAGMGAGGGSSTLMAGTVAEERAMAWRDLAQVLRGRTPRVYGEVPAALAQQSSTGDSNWFDCIAPSPLLDKLNKLRKPIGP